MTIFIVFVLIAFFYRAVLALAVFVDRLVDVIDTPDNRDAIIKRLERQFDERRWFGIEDAENYAILDRALKRHNIIDG